MDDVLCRFCSGEMPAGALFCPFCGKSVAEKKKPTHAPKKRGNGQGTIYKRGNSYVAVKTLGYYVGEDGKKHRKTVSKAFAKKKDAVEALPTMNEQQTHKPEKSTATFNDVYDKWFQTLTVGRDTKNCYRAAWKYFEPLHDLYAYEVDIDDLQECIDDCPHGKRTRENMKTVIGLIYKYGVPRGYFPEKLILSHYLKVSGDAGSGGTALPDSYVEKIQKSAGSVPGADLVLCQCYLGFRPSEFLALRHENYDPVRKTFTGGAKTAAGKNRVVTVSPKIQSIVDKYAALEGRQFFRSPKGIIMDKNDYRELFYSVLDALELDNPIIKVGEVERHTYTPHSCRHVFANLMKRASGSDKDKQALIGHTSSEMLRYYQNAPVEDLRKITDQF